MIQSAESILALKELLATLQGMRDAYQALHWGARGDNAYGDHLLFSRLYDGLTKEVDSLAEKILGVAPMTSILAVDQAALMAAQLSLGDGTVSGMLNRERVMVDATIPRVMDTLRARGELSDGLENHLQGVADAHEGNVYLLQQRVTVQKSMAGQDALRARLRKDILDIGSTEQPINMTDLRKLQSRYPEDDIRDAVKALVGQGALHVRGNELHRGVAGAASGPAGGTPGDNRGPNAKTGPYDVGKAQRFHVS